MEVNIRQLLDGLEDSSVPMEEIDVVSAMRIKELTRMKLKQETRNTTRVVRKRIITFALAAVLLLGLGAAAYAGGWFDRKQVVIVDRPIVLSQDPEPAEIEITGDEPAETPRVLTPDVPEEMRRVSVTQALAVPDDLDPETYARASNSVAATNEFRTWFFAQDPEPKEPTDILNKWAEQGWDSLTDEEVQIWRKYQQEMEEYSKRMFAEQNRVKRQIMEKYGLKERRVPETGNCLWSWETEEASDLDWFGEVRRDYRAMEGMLSNRELMDWISDNYCRGDYFATPPVGFDKVYWLPDGDFCVSYYLDLQQEGYQNWTGCYAYCSSYEVFHDGWEVGTWLEDGVNTTVRSYTAADGTELTIIRAGKQAVIYTFLPDYFFTETVYSTVELDDAALDIIAESIHYQNIGR
jgi:hypothetical protein